MKIAVVVRQVPDLIEPLELADSGNELDWEGVALVVNESDEHALEQAVLLKEKAGAEVTVVALDFGEIDNVLFTAAARGADRLIKIPLDEDRPPAEQATAAMLAEVVGGLSADLILIGCQAHDELQGNLAVRLAHTLGAPYVGVIRGVQKTDDPAVVRVFKEFPGAAMEQLTVRLPAVVGILAAEQPPRYVPVSRIRGAMKSTQLDEQEVDQPSTPAPLDVVRLSPPAAAQHAEMLQGDEDAVAGQLLEILQSKGFVK